MNRIRSLYERTNCCMCIRELVQPKHESILNKLDAYRSVFAQLMLDARIEVIAAYALNYLKLRVLKLTLIGIVLYNAIKEYYNDGTRKIIYFYSYTIEDNYNAIYDYYDNDEETRVRLRKLLEKIHDILLREFCEANNFTESVTYNDDNTV
ncbi:hypothetical protein HBI55_174900 [Parastagonospora nodorum]|nr:hypothetical protein HBI55_174900 [Parastagonospora nodorum]